MLATKEGGYSAEAVLVTALLVVLAIAIIALKVTQQGCPVGCWS